MSYGLQVFDASGGAVLDVSDRLTRLHSEYTVTLAPGQTVFVSVPGMNTDGTWAIVYNSFDLNYISITMVTNGFTVLFNPAWIGEALTFSFVVMRL